MPERRPYAAAGRPTRGFGTLLAEEEPTARFPRLFDSPRNSSTRSGDNIMQWTTPSYTDLRFGFEITMYIANR